LEGRGLIMAYSYNRSSKVAASLPEYNKVLHSLEKTFDYGRKKKWSASRAEGLRRKAKFKVLQYMKELENDSFPGEPVSTMASIAQGVLELVAAHAAYKAAKGNPNAKDEDPEDF
jgi:hypothetical protein